MIFSRVVNLRCEIDASSLFAFFTDSLSNCCPFPLEGSSEEATSLAGPVMMRIRDHRTLGQIVLFVIMPVYDEHSVSSDHYESHGSCDKEWDDSWRAAARVPRPLQPENAVCESVGKSTSWNCGLSGFGTLWYLRYSTV